MRLILRDNAESAAEYTAQYIIDRIRAFAPTTCCRFVLGLPSGEGAREISRHLVKRHLAGEVTFKDVIIFTTHEYVGLPRSHPQSIHGFMHTILFSKIDIPSSNINVLDGNATDLGAECRSYEVKLAAVGGFDLCIDEMSIAGGIALNESGCSLRSRTRAVGLGCETLSISGKLFQGKEIRAPQKALTVGVATVMEAREVIIIATGEQTDLAVQTCVEGGVNHLWIASFLQLHPCAAIVMDEDASLELKMKTVKRFRHVEEVESSLTIDGLAEVKPRKRCDRCGRGSGHALRARSDSDAAWSMDDYLESW